MVVSGDQLLNVVQEITAPRTEVIVFPGDSA
jgi:hypothetical protein